MWEGRRKKKQKIVRKAPESSSVDSFVFCVTDPWNAWILNREISYPVVQSSKLFWILGIKKKGKKKNHTTRLQRLKIIAFILVSGDSPFFVRLTQRFFFSSLLNMKLPLTIFAFCAWIFLFYFLRLREKETNWSFHTPCWLSKGNGMNGKFIQWRCSKNNPEKRKFFFSFSLHNMI